jgi:hypothetical protein
MTFQHYYLKAVSKCMFFGTPGDVTYCHQLANLCVLQLYDTNSQACADHLTIVNARSTSYVNDLTNWVTGMPWLYFGGDDAHSVCTTFNYKKRMTLSGAVVNYVLAGFYMNGTFAGERQCCGIAVPCFVQVQPATSLVIVFPYVTSRVHMIISTSVPSFARSHLGYQPLSTQLSYCGRKAPYTERGELRFVAYSRQYTHAARRTPWNGGCQWYYAVLCPLLAPSYTPSHTCCYYMCVCGELNPRTVLMSAGGGTSRTTEWLFYGTNDKESFSCALDTLLTKEQMFYELFIHGKDESYTPVPVRITNIARTTSAKVNVKYPTVPLCESADVLTRRFFLYDVASGVTSVNSANQPVTTVIRYASYISLEASLVTNKFARIYAPVLTITYEEVKPANWPANPADRIDFNMAYTMTMDEFFVNFRTFFIIIMVFTGLLFALRYRNWQIRNARVVTSAALTTDLGGFNMSTIIEMCLYASSTWVLVFFPVTVCIAWYAFTFFKIQSAPSVLLPPERDVYSPDSPYYLFVVNIHVMAFFQLFNVLVLVYRQCRADLFFVDWEPLPTKQPTASGASKGSVSVWRTILVANEWTELQTVRKTDIRFTLFFLGFVLLGEALSVFLRVRLMCRVPRRPCQCDL